MLTSVKDILKTTRSMTIDLKILHEQAGHKGTVRAPKTKRTRQNAVRQSAEKKKGILMWREPTTYYAAGGKKTKKQTHIKMGVESKKKEHPSHRPETSKEAVLEKRGGKLNRLLIRKATTAQIDAGLIGGRGLGNLSLEMRYTKKKGRVLRDNTGRRGGSGRKVFRNNLLSLTKKGILDQTWDGRRGALTVRERLVRRDRGRPRRAWPSKTSTARPWGEATNIPRERVYLDGRLKNLRAAH